MTDAVELLAQALEHAARGRISDIDWHRATARALLPQLVAAEREACAKACDKIAGNTADFSRDYRRAAGGCAAAIRARSEGE